MKIPLLFINALISVESGGNDRAVGDGGNAVGCLQIWPAVVEDCNRIARLPAGQAFTLKDRESRDRSIEMLNIYMRHYARPERLGREPSLEDMARIWNGGPNGYRNVATARYWEKVLGRLQVIAGFNVATVGSDAPNVEGVPIFNPENFLATTAPAAPKPSTPAHTAEDRQAWDHYVAAAYGALARTTEAAEAADRLLAERRKRFPS